MASRSFFFGLCAVLLLPAFAMAYTSPGHPSGYVNDFTGTLSDGERSLLERQLAEFHASTSGEVVVAVVENLQDESIERYANMLFREWGVGKKTLNNGALLVVALSEHEVRIEVGYGYEGVLTDAQSSQIIRDIMIPRFREGKYGAGITEGVTAIIGTIEGEPIPPPPSATPKFSFSGNSMEWLLLVSYLLFNWIVSILGRSKSWWLGGVFGGSVGLGVFGIFGQTAGVWALALLIPLGLLLDFVVSRGYSKSIVSGTNPPWWTGGSSLGGFSGGGSFGGFGGGSSGGGGASGRW